MNRAEYLDFLKEYNLTQIRAGAYFGLKKRQAQRIALGECPVPKPVAILIQLLLERKIELADLEELDQP